MKIETDIVIVGTGVAGLFCALNLPRDKKIYMITKSDLESSDSFLAQGGICVQRDEQDYDSYFEDTMKAGHYENRKESVDIMIRSSRQIIDNLVGYGVEFEQEQVPSPTGNPNADSQAAPQGCASSGSGSDEPKYRFIYTREGAHSKPRILYHKDITGKEITGKLLAQVKKLENVTLCEYTSMTDLLVEDGVCTGILAKHLAPDDRISDGVYTESGTTEPNPTDGRDTDGNPLDGRNTDGNPLDGRNTDGNPLDSRNTGAQPFQISARYTILATGGIGGLYEHSTNYPHLTGDALEISKKHGVRLQDMDHVQFHPTTLYSKKPGRRFLISESVRGEGAVLYNKNKERFVNELLPRDVVAAAIREQMEKDGTDFVWLSMAPIDKETILRHFPNIYQHCLEEGYDVTKECIPVVPAQHYFMGGIWVDSDSQTSMPHLFAAGETSCNGVHGANRLASNSLLESLVFAKRAALKITERIMDEGEQDE